MKTTTLANRATVYVPQSRHKEVLPLLQALLDVSGGLTTTEGVGVWAGPNDTVQEEPVYLVQVFYGADWRQRHDTERAIMRLIQKLLDLGEVEVLVEWNGGAVLYGADDAA